MLKKHRGMRFVLKAPWGDVVREFVLVEIGDKQFWCNTLTGSLYHDESGESVTSTTLRIDFEAEVQQRKRTRKEKPVRFGDQAL